MEGGGVAVRGGESHNLSRNRTKSVSKYQSYCEARVDAPFPALHRLLPLKFP